MLARSNTLPIVLFVVCLCGAVLCGSRLQLVEERGKPEVIALPEPSVARVLALGYTELAADLYFIRAGEYYGNPFNYRDHYKYLYPLVDLVSELAPNFREPLGWGGLAVQQNLGRETWLNTSESTKLLRKAVTRFPEFPEYHIWLAYNLAVFDADYIGAAHELEKAVGLPGCPSYVPLLITRLYSTAGDLGTAEQLAQSMMNGTTDPRVKEAMKNRVIDIETERQLRKLDALGKQFNEKMGFWPADGAALVIAGLVTHLPAEPRGGSWYFDPDTHLAMSTKMKQRLHIFERKASPLPKKEEKR